MPRDKGGLCHLVSRPSTANSAGCFFSSSFGSQWSQNWNDVYSQGKNWDHNSFRVQKFLLTCPPWISCSNLLTGSISRPTNLQYSSGSGTPSPQVAVATILLPWAKLKYGGVSTWPSINVKNWKSAMCKRKNLSVCNILRNNSFCITPFTVYYTSLTFVNTSTNHLHVQWFGLLPSFH